MENVNTNDGARDGGKWVWCLRICCIAILYAIVVSKSYSEESPPAEFPFCSNGCTNNDDALWAVDPQLYYLMLQAIREYEIKGEFPVPRRYNLHIIVKFDASDSKTKQSLFCFLKLLTLDKRWSNFIDELKISNKLTQVFSGNGSYTYMFMDNSLFGELKLGTSVNDEIIIDTKSVVFAEDGDDVIKSNTYSSVAFGGKGNDVFYSNKKPEPKVVKDHTGKTYISNIAFDLFLGGDGDDVYVLTPGCGVMGVLEDDSELSGKNKLSLKEFEYSEIDISIDGNGILYVRDVNSRNTWLEVPDFIPYYIGDDEVIDDELLRKYPPIQSIETKDKILAVRDILDAANEKRR